MTESATPLLRLKRRLERLEHIREKGARGVFSLGLDSLDQKLGGGLALGAMHEISAIAHDHASGSGFALLFALRASAGRPILWVREDKGARQHGQLYGAGLIELGARPEEIILVNAPDTLQALRAGADILNCGGLGAVVIEPYAAATALDLTASRKLVLAAERSGVTFASAASTRWQVCAAASATLSGKAPGHPAFSVELVRHRGGVVPFSMVLEWNRDERVFRMPELLRPVLSVVERGQVAA
jgi:protein ImuA